LNYVPYSLRPHYVEIFRIYINEKYGLKIPKINLDDNYIEVGSEEYDDIVSKIKEYLKEKSVSELIVYEACKRYREILDNDYKARYDVVNWAAEYLNRNAEKQQVNGEIHYLLEKDDKNQEFDDVTHFLMEYVFCEDLQKVRMIAIEEIMRDKGYIKKNTKIMGTSDYNKSLKIEKALRYSEREGELDFIKSELEDIIQKKELDNHVIFDAIVNYENYGEIADLIIKGPLYKDLKNEMLVFMARKNDVARLKVLLKKNADIETKQGHQKNTPLIEAVLYNSKQAMEVLLRRGANINERNYDYQTALEVATFRNNYDVVKYLLNNGASVNLDIVDYVDDNGKIILTNIVSKIRYTKENNELIKLFIDKGANVNMTSLMDPIHVTPIIKACAEDNYDIVKLLIQNGQDLNSITKMGDTKFPFKRKKWYKEAYKNYKKYKKDKSIQKTLHEMTELKKACSNNDLDKVKSILMLDSCVGYRRVALKMLVQIENEKNFLEREELKKRILDELEVFDGDNYLEWAINTNDKKIVDLLIKNKKIVLQDINDKSLKNSKNLIKLAENINNKDIINVLKTNESSTQQLKKNALGSVNNSSLSLNIEIK